MKGYQLCTSSSTFLELEDPICLLVTSSSLVVDYFWGECNAMEYGVSKLLMIDETPRTRTSSLEYLFRIHNRTIKFYSRGLVSVNITAVLLRKCNTPILKMVMVRKVLSHISNFENLLRNVPPTSDRARSRHVRPKFWKQNF